MSPGVSLSVNQNSPEFEKPIHLGSQNSSISNRRAVG